MEEFHADSPLPQTTFQKIFIKVLFSVTMIILLVAFLFVNIILFSKSIRNLLFKADAVQYKLLNPLPISGMYFGATIDWENGDTPSKFTEALTRPPAYYNFFMEVHDQLQLVKEFKSIVDLVANAPPCVLGLTIMPSQGFSVLNDATYDQLGRVMKTINDLGIPVFLRYGHEMNGNWYTYGQQPVAYKASFIKLTNAIRKYTKDTKMVWAPNSSAGYPDYGSSPSATLTKTGTAEFNALDTNGDGVVNYKDDPYTPYYPGDQYVDWIGFSTFYFGDPSRLNGNKIPEYGIFLNSIDPPSGAFSLYKMFVSGKSKPLAIMETASTYYPTNVVASDPTHFQIKRAWWSQIFNETTRSKLPLLKLVAWFNVKKMERDATNTLVLRDFTVTSDPSIVSNLMKTVPNFVYFADSV